MAEKACCPRCEAPCHDPKITTSGLWECRECGAVWADWRQALAAADPYQLVERHRDAAYRMALAKPLPIEVPDATPSRYGEWIISTLRPDGTVTDRFAGITSGAVVERAAVVHREKKRRQKGKAPPVRAKPAGEKVWQWPGTLYGHRCEERRQRRGREPA